MGQVERVQYEDFGLHCMAGRKVTHLTSYPARTQCGLQRLGLRVKQDGSMPVCKRCKKTVKIVRMLGKRIGVYKSSGVVTAWPESKLPESSA